MQHESLARKIMSSRLGIALTGQEVSTLNKEKKFDLVNIDSKIIGDAKYIMHSAQSEKDNVSAYVWLMEKLERATEEKWRKIIIGGGSREFFTTYAREYDPWLQDVEIYYLSDDGRIEEIRTVTGKSEAPRPNSPI
jgi:hypothetical protein